MIVVKAVLGTVIVLYTSASIFICTSMISQLHDDEESLKGLINDLGYIAQTFYIIVSESRLWTILGILLSALLLPIPLAIYIILYLLDLVLLHIDRKFLK